MGVQVAQDAQCPRGFQGKTMRCTLPMRRGWEGGQQAQSEKSPASDHKGGTLGSQLLGQGHVHPLPLAFTPARLRAYVGIWAWSMICRTSSRMDGPRSTCRESRELA